MFSLGVPCSQLMMGSFLSVAEGRTDPGKQLVASNTDVSPAILSLASLSLVECVASAVMM